MTRFKGCLAAILLLGFAGCGGDDEDSGAPSSLQQAVDHAAASPACSHVVTASWVHSLPVPTKEPQRYAVFFYPLSGAQALSPTADAVVDAGSGETVSCVVRPNAPQTLGPAKESSSSMSSQLFTQTEAVGSIFQMKKEDDSIGEKTKLFMDRFQKSADPQFLREYYHLDPDFWEWIHSKSNQPLLPSSEATDL